MAASVAIVAAAALTWAVLGTVPTRVTGQGVLLASGKGFHSIQPAVSGPIIELLVKRGDVVEVNAPIAHIRQISMEGHLATAETRVAMLQRDLVELKQANALQLSQIDATGRRQKELVRKQLAAARVRAEGLKEILTAEEALSAKGLVSRLELANARSRYDETMHDIASYTAREVDIEAEADQKRDALDAVARQKQQDIDALHAEAARLRSELASGSEVRSPITGEIDEVRVALGDVVSPGHVIATIGHLSPESFEVIAVFGNDMSKRILPGMDVHVRPVTVRKEEHGSMRGHVLSITELGVSKAELNALFRNPQLTASLGGESWPLLARVDVTMDKSTPSGFAWWGGRGPPYPITRGTRVAVDVIIERRSPISLIIPAFRSLAGLEG
jgi:HlyD family secretion protein